MLIALSLVSRDNPCADALRCSAISGPRAYAPPSVGWVSAGRRAWMSASPTPRVGGNKVCENRITADDAVRLLSMVVSEPRVSEERQRVLPNCVLNSRMPAHLGDRYRIGHKTGTLTPHGVVNDVGFVHLPAGVLSLAFLTSQERSVATASQDIAAITRDIVHLTDERLIP